MPTGQNLCEVQRKCGVKGTIELHERASTMNSNKNLVEEGVDRRVRGGVVASLPRQKPSRGRRWGWWWIPR